MSNVIEIPIRYGYPKYSSTQGHSAAGETDPSNLLVRPYRLVAGFPPKSTPKTQKTCLRRIFRVQC